MQSCKSEKVASDRFIGWRGTALLLYFLIILTRISQTEGSTTDEEVHTVAVVIVVHEDACDGRAGKGEI